MKRGEAMTVSTLNQHPLRVLEEEAPVASQDLTILLTQHGVGKTAALMNFGLNRLLAGQTVRHFTANMTTEKARGYYQEIYADFTQHFIELQVPAWDKIKANLVILSYPNTQEMVRGLEAELDTISEQIHPISDLVIIDDLDYHGPIENQIERISEVARQREPAILAGVTVHRDQSGTVPLEEPASTFEPYCGALYYMEPDPLHDRVMLDIVKNGRTRALSLFFDPHKLIFRLQ
jgi:hypothetical protein